MILPERKNFNFVPSPKCDYSVYRVSNNGKRWYEIEQTGEKFPSITTVLSAGDQEWLEKWKAEVGEERAERVSRVASQTGTQFHKACENYLKNKHPFTTDEEVKMFVPMIFPRFKKFQPILNRIDNIMFQENMMCSRKIGVAGTCDCVAEFDGVLSIIDFKTSKRKKKRDDIIGYFTQETAYAIMMFDMYGIKINNLVTLISVEDEEPQVFIEKPKDHYENLKHCIDIFHRKNDAQK